MEAPGVESGAILMIPKAYGPFRYHEVADVAGIMRMERGNDISNPASARDSCRGRTGMVHWPVGVTTNGGSVVELTC